MKSALSHHRHQDVTKEVEHGVIISLHKTKQCTGMSGQNINRHLSFFLRGEGAIFSVFVHLKKKPSTFYCKQARKIIVIRLGLEFFAIHTSTVLFCFIITAH